VCVCVCVCVWCVLCCVCLVSTPKSSPLVQLHLDVPRNRWMVSEEAAESQDHKGKWQSHARPTERRSSTGGPLSSTACVHEASAETPGRVLLNSNRFVVDSAKFNFSVLLLREEGQAIERSLSGLRGFNGSNSVCDLHSARTQLTEHAPIPNQQSTSGSPN
jgi:hypothetical protein